MSTASEACQRAIYALIGSALSCPVYDQPPESPAFPYVVVGDAVTTARNTFGRMGRLVMADVVVWSRSGADAAQDGYGEAEQVAGEVLAILDGASLPETDGWVFPQCLFAQSNKVRSSDGLTRQIRVRYEVWAEAA